MSSAEVITNNDERFGTTDACENPIKSCVEGYLAARNVLAVQAVNLPTTNQDEEQFVSRQWECLQTCDRMLMLAGDIFARSGRELAQKFEFLRLSLQNEEPSAAWMHLFESLERDIRLGYIPRNED